MNKELVYSYDELSTPVTGETSTLICLETKESCSGIRPQPVHVSVCD